MKRNLLTVLTALSLGTLAVACSSAQAAESIPAPLALAMQGGLKIESHFDAAGGLKGWVLSSTPGHDMVVFTSADGKVAIAGTMLNGKGENLTEKYLAKYAPKTNYQQFLPLLQKSAYVADGPGAGKPVRNVIYAISDPNCPYCHMTWQALRPYVAKGLEIRWVMTAVLGGDSANKAAQILSAKVPLEALDKEQKAFGQEAPSAYPVSAGVREKLNENMALLTKMGFGGVPALIYKDSKGNWTAINGAPQPEKLDEIAGFSLK